LRTNSNKLFLSDKSMSSCLLQKIAKATPTYFRARTRSLDANLESAMKSVVTIIMLLTTLGCASSSSRPAALAFQYDPGVLGTTIMGLAVGMTPRRVLSEFEAREWSYTSSTPMTLEDMIENSSRSGLFFISTKASQEPDLEIFFDYGVVILVRETQGVEAGQLAQSVEEAKRDLSRLGEFTESTDGSSIKLTYSPNRGGYVYYDFHKLVEEQRDYRVWKAVGNYPQ